MIVQITMVRNELTLLKSMLPVWKNYADGFVFLLDRCTDESFQFLNEVKQEFNILEILTTCNSDDSLVIETEMRQDLFDAAYKYTNKIICLDGDEYLDGSITKQELVEILDNNPDTLFHLQWVQYTSNNTIRVDGPWRNNYKDRVGCYNQHCQFAPKQNHSTHLPISSKQLVLDPSQLFIAHLQWIDKNHVAIKQYYWKTYDYVNNKKYGVEVVGNRAYDESVNNFEWEEEYFDYPLRIRDDVFEDQTNGDNYRVEWIREQTIKHNIPNLGDWGYNIHNSIPMYFCTAADDKHFPLLLNLLGSIHQHNFYDVEKILVYDLGLSEIHKKQLQNIKRVELCEVEQTNPDILKDIETGLNRKVKGLFSWKPVIIKDALERYPYILYLDAGTTILKPLNELFKHIKQNGHFFTDCGHSIKWMTTESVTKLFSLHLEENKWLLSQDLVGIDAGFQGLSRKVYEDYILPMYEFSKDIANFTDDGTTEDGWGTARHDQTLFSILARQLGYAVEIHDNDNVECNLLVDGQKQKIHITHRRDRVNNDTLIFRSRWTFDYQDYKSRLAAIKRNYIISIITGIGPLEKYEKFIDTYFDNLKQQTIFDRSEVLIIYSEWSNLFDKYRSWSNIRFIKEQDRLGVYNAWNQGILNATAEYITNWNIDDLRFPINNKIKYDTLSKNPDIDLVYNWYVAVSPQELEDGVDLAQKPVQKYPDDYHLYTHIACMAGPDPLWRKSFHLYGGLFNYKEYSIIGDWEMWWRMSRYGLKFKLIPHTLCIYVEHPNTVSNSDNTKLESQKAKLIQQYKN